MRMNLDEDKKRMHLYKRLYQDFVDKYGKYKAIVGIGAGQKMMDAFLEYINNMPVYDVPTSLDLLEIAAYYILERAASAGEVCKTELERIRALKDDVQKRIESERSKMRELYM